MNRIARVSLAVVAVAGVGCLAAVAYSSLHNKDGAKAGITPIDAPTSTHSARPSPSGNTVAQATRQPEMPQEIAPSARQSPTPAMVSQWISAATGSDAQARAEAITALANAPKAEALPVLRKVLEVGDPEVDRQLALSSLHALALEQGDTDGRIRKTLRDAIYHGDDDSVGQGAQTIVEDIERNPTGRQR